ncbi:MAG: hypothetical protein ACJ77E_00010 [Gaiellaceae bacterium]
MARHDIEIPDHVASYLLRVTISNIPTPVLETLAKMSAEDIEVLDRLRVSFEESEARPQDFVFAFH